MIYNSQKKGYAFKKRNQANPYFANACKRPLSSNS
jgi:hypothetical protein